MEILIIVLFILGIFAILFLIDFVKKIIDVTRSSEEILELFNKAENFHVEKFILHSRPPNFQLEKINLFKVDSLSKASQLACKVQKDNEHLKKKHIHRAITETEISIKTYKEMSDIFRIK
ncbi:hypothetical protein [Dyadobacter arcticus]|uniref:Uncharacterized protein n=1 Tax=Dyadobacter arcticus TaxID=1078754 RepID=A0ABX0UGQ4_9BACT|nr:hypothetical protein [Dyadobacter arcticus]NIJ52189.1 hypothetical protein [Dyadobacter arcticus]